MRRISGQSIPWVVTCHAGVRKGSVTPDGLLSRARCSRALATSLLLVPHVVGVTVDNGSTPFLGDGIHLTTVSPNGDGFRDVAHVNFTLTSRARVALDVVATDTVKGDPEHGSEQV